MPGRGADRMTDYKRVWNGLSGTLSDAGRNTCCLDREDQICQDGAASASFLREVLEITQCDHVLEIVCGIGRIGRELAPWCGQWHGANISGNMIAFARDRLRALPNVHLYELLRSDLGIFPDARFDRVYASIVFLHLDQLDVFTYVRESHRVVKPGGKVYFDAYNLLAPSG
jgi:ubiquinone/menaquinone biosynthesis C-methylase UbiE